MEKKTLPMNSLNLHRVNLIENFFLSEDPPPQDPQEKREKWLNKEKL